jgi:hypothetical protein
MCRLNPRVIPLLALIVAGGCATQIHGGLGNDVAFATGGAASSHQRSARGVANELYVANYSGTVYVFPIQGGLPITTPTRTLQAGMDLTSLAVGSDGTIYAVGESRINVYAPGAEGSDQPERVLNVDGYGAWSVAIDQQGYLYVGVFNEAVNVYAPGAQGNDQPVVSIPEQYLGLIGGLAIDGAGNLYVTTDESGLTEYATPHSSPTEIKTTCFEVKSGVNGVAVASDGTAFVAVDGSPHRGRTSYISPVAASQSGCPFKRRRLYAVPTLLDPIGVAELDGHLFVSDQKFGNSGPAVVVMDESQRGHRAPLLVLKDSNFDRPRGVAIGP